VTLHSVHVLRPLKSRFHLRLSPTNLRCTKSNGHALVIALIGLRRGDMFTTSPIEGEFARRKIDPLDRGFESRSIAGTNDSAAVSGVRPVRGEAANSVRSDRKLVQIT
jgi:hypothetical protein